MHGIGGIVREGERENIMIPFFNRNKNPEAAPEWTSFDSLSEYEDFIHLVKKYFDRKGIKFRLHEDALDADDPGWHYGQMGLSNLAQMCKQSHRSKWKAIIFEHFDSMQRTASFESAFYERAHDY